MTTPNPLPNPSPATPAPPAIRDSEGAASHPGPPPPEAAAEVPVPEAAEEVLSTAAAETPTPTRAEVQAGTAGRRRRTGWRRALVWASVVLLLLAAAGLWVGTEVSHRLSVPPPVAVVHPVLSASVTAGGVAPALPWPPMGQAAVAIPAIGFAEQSGGETPVPVASLTKMMTAYIVLKDHPLPLVPASGPPPPGVDGPSITLTPADVSYFDADTGLDESNAPVQMGEVLTERQLIEGALIHSANNFALTLGRWDAGSLPAFVAKMNATASALGMSATHFVDASGFDPHSQSTAADLLKVAAAGMAEPAFEQSVAMTSVTLPVAGTLQSYTPLDGVDGVEGVKSGFTSAAGGCDVMAAVRDVQGHPVTVLAAITGQEQWDALASAGLYALGLVNAAATGVVEVPVLRAGQPVAAASVNGHTVAAVATSSLSVLAWPDQVVHRGMAMTHPVKAGDPAGTVLGIVRAVLGSQAVVATAETARRLPPLTLMQRLF